MKDMFAFVYVLLIDTSKNIRLHCKCSARDKHNVQYGYDT